MKAARYLNWRINRQVNAEDTALVAKVQAGMASQSFTVGPLSEQEVALRHFCGRMRALIPQARLHRAPGAGWSASHPLSLRGRDQGVGACPKDDLAQAAYPHTNPSPQGEVLSKGSPS